MIVTRPSFSVKEVNLSKSANAYVGKEVTVPGIEREVRFSAYRNAESPIFTIPDSKVSDVSSMILWKALAPIVVTFPGIVSEVRLVPTKAELPIWVTPVPIETDVTWLLI